MSYVYFMRRADGVGPIKIGCSKVPIHRLEAHQHWSPEILEIVATVEGGFTDEQRLHRQFASYRLHGEWFEASRPVLATVAKAASAGRLPAPTMDDRWERISALYRQGHTLDYIGDQFSITRERVRQILRKNGVASLGHRPELSRTAPAWGKVAQIVELAKAGRTISEIAEAIGDGAHNIRSVLKSEGVKAKRGKRVPSEASFALATEIAADYKNGLRTADIAARHGFSQPQIYRYLKLAGVKPSRQKHAA